MISRLFRAVPRLDFLPGRPGRSEIGEIRSELASGPRLVRSYGDFYRPDEGELGRRIGQARLRRFRGSSSWPSRPLCQGGVPARVIGHSGGAVVRSLHRVEWRKVSLTGP
jgi:hypothetical protein